MTREEKLLKEKESFMDYYNTQLKAIHQKQNECCHEWDSPIYEPEEKLEYDFDMTRQGSDIWPTICGSHTVKVPRWSRICKLCEKKEYTYTQQAVKYEPKFS